ncbi:PAS domain S-box protein [Streptomyces sp. NPDC093111]|uniref:PAS domain S-box protein n=1 Tax=Streptomyces sp. NPDC093111 TaxID=3154978 RepID=UPI00342ADF0B
MNFENSHAVLSSERPAPRGQVLDLLPDAVLIVDDNGTVVRANLAAAALLGHERHTVEGRGVLDFLPSFDWNLTRLPAATEPSGTPHGARLRTTALAAGGRSFAAEIGTARLDRHAVHEGLPYGSSLVVSLRDMTPDEDARATLARSLLQAEAVLRTADEALIGTDAEGRIDLVNPAAARLLGGKASELGGRELLALLTSLGYDGEPMDDEDAPLARALRTGRASRIPAQELRTGDGTRLTADVSVRPVTQEGRNVGAVVALTDRGPYEKLADEYVAAQIRCGDHKAELEQQRKRTDRAVDRTRELTEFLAGPVMGALHHLHAEMGRLADDGSRPLWPEATVSLEALVADVRMTMALVDTRSRPHPHDSAPAGPRRRTVPIDDVVQAGVRAAAALAGPNRVQVSVHAPRFFVHVDPDDMTTAVGRLIADVVHGDAVHADAVHADVDVDAVHADGEPADPGPHHVFVAALHQRGLLRIEVRGPYNGGAREHFDIVQGIATAHGGTLRTHRAPGVSGSTYVLELPSAVHDEGVAGADGTPADALRPTGRHRSLTA